MTVLPARRPTWQSRVIAYSEELSKEDQERDQRTGKANSEEQQLDRLVDELLIHTANGQQLDLTVEAHQLEAEVARAEKELAVVFFADDPAAAHSAISALGLFPAEDVHNLAVV